MWRFDLKLQVSFGTRKRRVATVLCKSRIRNPRASSCSTKSHHARTSTLSRAGSKVMHGNTAPGTPAMAAPATSMHVLAASAPDSARVATPASGMAAEVPQVPEMAPRQPLAVVAGSAPRKRRSTTENKENRAVMLPAHGFNAGGKAFRGKQRSRTPARSVGAQQHHAQNLCKTQDGLASWAVEGTVAGSDGQQHYAMGISILAVNGRVSANPSGGRLRKLPSNRQRTRARRSLCWPMMREKVMGRVSSARAPGVAYSVTCPTRC